MQTNTPNLPEWAESMVEPVARKLVELRIRINRRWDTEPAELERLLPTAIDYNWREEKDKATAALAEALPMVAEHFAVVVDDKFGDPEIADAIRREVGL